MQTLKCYWESLLERKELKASKGIGLQAMKPSMRYE